MFTHKDQMMGLKMYNKDVLFQILSEKIASKDFYNQKKVTDISWSM